MRTITRLFPAWRQHTKTLLLTTLLSAAGTSAIAQFPAPYCSVTFANGVEPITLVQFAGINNTTPAPIGGTAHEDFTAIQGTVYQGFSMPIKLKGNTDGSFTSYFRVYIDWNQNGSFTDAGESYDIGTIASSNGTDAKELNGNIATPAGATLGATRMRVIKKFNAYPTDACTIGGGTTQYGQAEDYTLNVMAAPCTAPVATYAIVPDCSNGQFSISVNISNMGSATSIAINDGATTLGTASATGSTVVGPFASGSSKTLTLVHNVNTLCNVTSAAQAYICPAPNDDVANAITVPVNADFNCTSVIAGSTAGASASLPAPSCRPTGANDDVWFKFQATGAIHRVSLINTAGESDMNMVVYSDLGITEVPGGGTCANVSAQYLTGLTAGQTYYVRVFTFVATAATSNFNICVGTPPPPPANDECANAINVPVNTGTTCTSVISGTLAGATASAGPASSCGTYDDDVWFSFTALANAHTITLQNLAGSTSDLTFQVLSACGASTAMVCSDPQTALVSGLVPGNTYYLRVASYTSAGGQTSTFDVCITTQVMNFVSTTTIQASSSSLTAGTVDQQILRVAVVVSGTANPLSVTQLDFNTTGSTNAANIAAAKVYYTGTSNTFAATTPFGTPVNSPSGSFSVTGNQALTGGASNTTNYFWLVYDVNCAATSPNVLDAQYTSATIGTPRTPTATNPSGTRAITNASFTASTNQPMTSTVFTGSTDQQVLRVALTGCANTAVTSIAFSTTGSTAPADITAARVYYTTTTTFATATPFGSTIPNPNGAFTVNGSQTLATGTGYFWLVYDISATATAGNVVDASCSSAMINGNTATPTTPNPTGTRTILQALVNDNASGAMTLTLGSGCTGAPYTNVNASQSAGEPVSNCSSSSGFHTVWFKFTAPASGAVRVSTDMGSGGTMTDTRLGLFTAADPSVYSGFSIIACDDDGGSFILDPDDEEGYMSVVYATGLVPNQTYYVEVDGFSSSTTGTFCIAVDELSSSMLATSADCNSDVQIPEPSTLPPMYTGWVPLMDASSRLIALVRNNAGGSVGNFTPAQNINTGAIRQDAGGRPYLDRNFRISNSTTGSYEVQLFLLNSEQAALQAADPSASLGNLNVTRVTGESSCNNNGSGTYSLLTQTESNTANGVSWIKFATPGFSNFFISSGTTPLPVKLLSFTGKKVGASHILTWETAEERNFSHFELQRSADGRQFSKLATLPGNKKGNYSFIDERPLNGMNLYRLNMADADGKVVLSDVVTLIRTQAGQMAVVVSPNPVQQQLQVLLDGHADGKPELQLMDITGRVLQTVTVTGAQATIDMSRLATGSYLLRYADNSQQSVIRISKQ